MPFIYLFRRLSKPFVVLRKKVENRKEGSVGIEQGGGGINWGYLLRRLDVSLWCCLIAFLGLYIHMAAAEFIIWLLQRSGRDAAAGQEAA